MLACQSRQYPPPPQTDQCTKLGSYVLDFFGCFFNLQLWSFIIIIICSYRSVLPLSCCTSASYASCTCKSCGLWFITHEPQTHTQECMDLQILSAFCFYSLHLIIWWEGWHLPFGPPLCRDAGLARGFLFIFLHTQWTINRPALTNQWAYRQWLQPSARLSDIEETIIGVIDGVLTVLGPVVFYTGDGCLRV